jgi:hypothetical protein
MAYVPPSPGTVGTNLANNVGQKVIDGALDLAPVAVPFILALAAINWVMRKFGLKKKASLNV